MIEVTLNEYERASVEMSAAHARELAQTASGRISVDLGGEPGVFTLKATDHVGTLVAPGIAVLVRPKVPIHNLFGLLDVGLPPEAWQAETFAFGADRDVLPAFSSFFARVTDGAIALGLHRSYRPAQSRLIAMRGRLDFPAMIRRPDIESPVPCRYEDYTVDVAENRALLAALRRFRTIAGVPTEARRRMLRLEARLQGVTATLVRPNDIDGIQLSRLNQHYAPALRLAELVLGGSSLLDRRGEFAASSFMLSMNDLFERYVTSRLQRSVASARVLPQDKRSLDWDRRVTMYPDLVFAQEERAVYVADVKYKITATGQARNDDYYQLLAYATALRVPEGVLVYCQSEGGAPPREIVVGEGRKRLMTYPLDLSGPPVSVESQLQRLGEWITERIRATAFAG